MLFKLLQKALGEGRYFELAGFLHNPACEKEHLPPCADFPDAIAENRPKNLKKSEVFDGVSSESAVIVFDIACARNA